MKFIKEFIFTISWSLVIVLQGYNLIGEIQGKQGKAIHSIQTSSIVMVVLVAIGCAIIFSKFLGLAAGGFAAAIPTSLAIVMYVYTKFNIGGGLSDAQWLYATAFDIACTGSMFLGICILVIKDKAMGAILVGSHAGVDIHLLLVNASRIGYPTPNLDWAPPIPKALIFGGIAVVLLYFSYKFRKEKCVYMADGIDTIGFAVLFCCACYFASLATSKGMERFFCSFVLVLTSFWTGMFYIYNYRDDMMDVDKAMSR